MGSGTETVLAYGLGAAVVVAAEVGSRRKRWGVGGGDGEAWLRFGWLGLGCFGKSRGLPLYNPAKSGLSELFVFVMVGALDRALSLADFPGHVSYILLMG